MNTLESIAFASVVSFLLFLYVLRQHGGYRAPFWRFPGDAWRVLRELWEKIGKI